jgi:hypothetical protein
MPKEPAISADRGVMVLASVFTTAKSGAKRHDHANRFLRQEHIPYKVEVDGPGINVGHNQPVQGKRPTADPGTVRGAGLKPSGAGQGPDLVMHLASDNFDPVSAHFVQDNRLDGIDGEKVLNAPVQSRPDGANADHNLFRTGEKIRQLGQGCRGQDALILLGNSQFLSDGIHMAVDFHDGRAPSLVAPEQWGKVEGRFHDHDAPEQHSVALALPANGALFRPTM